MVPTAQQLTITVVSFIAAACVLGVVTIKPGRMSAASCLQQRRSEQRCSCPGAALQQPLPHSEAKQDDSGDPGGGAAGVADTRPVVCLVAGVEGTGHHFFHIDVWPKLAVALPGAYHDHGFEVTRGKQKLSGKSVSSLLVHNLERNARDAVKYTPFARQGIFSMRLDDVSGVAPADFRYLFVDTPSFPASPLGMEERQAFHNPDILALDKAIAVRREDWTMRTLVIVRNWPDTIRSVSARGIKTAGLPPSMLNTALVLQMAATELNAQLSAFTLPWAVLEFEKLIASPADCSRAIADFYGLPPDPVEQVITSTMKKPSSAGKKSYNADELEWISQTFGGEEAQIRWPVLLHAWKHRGIC